MTCTTSECYEEEEEEELIISEGNEVSNGRGLLRVLEGVNITTQHLGGGGSHMISPQYT